MRGAHVANLTVLALAEAAARTALDPPAPRVPRPPDPALDLTKLPPLIPGRRRGAPAPQRAMIPHPDIPAGSLVTERLVLCPPNPDDLEAYALLVQARGVLSEAPVPSRVETPESRRPLAREAAMLHAEDAIGRLIDHRAALGHGPRLVFLKRRDGLRGGLLGMAGIRRRSDEVAPDPGRPAGQDAPLEWELIYLLGRPFWGLGLATEAARATLDEAAAVLGITEVAAFTLADNAVSVRVLEKLGFVPTGQRLGYGLLLDSFHRTAPQ